MNLKDIRQVFLAYFQAQGHSIVPSSSLIPEGDDTLLFTNAGMVQFKDVFLGAKSLGFHRATSSQRCVRAGGKHNDLENVGYTARHHTFFEMLGNFSFGNYFKREAIEFAWKFLTEELKIPKEKLWVTVYVEDDEAAQIWLQDMKIDPTRFSRCGDADNFWSMGETGPCGPCTEIFYDHGPDVPGGPPGTPEADGDRYIEIWNLVFMQYDRSKDGELKALPKPSVDTGMGLERIAAVMQGVHSNYEIDLFKALISAAIKVTGAKDKSSPSLKVIADHIRAVSFLIVDGVIPSNEGRGYVLRRIIRRAVRHGHRLNAPETFFHKLVDALVKEMGEAYPELIASQSFIEQVIQAEENQFALTLNQGMKILNAQLEDAHNGVLSGDVAFKLYDTYGFPLDLTADVARERGMEVDHHGFEKQMQAQREKAKAASGFSSYQSNLNVTVSSTFSGYGTYKDTGAVRALYREGQAVEILSTGDVGVIVLDNTPFYAESGGQIGDIGHLSLNDALFNVRDTQKSNEAIIHIGEVVSGQFKLEDSLTAEIDDRKRKEIAAHHSVTHLLHAALIKVLGSHIQQKGSLVESDYTRFDFSHTKGMTREELIQVQDLVREEILKNTVVSVEEMTPSQAKKKGAMALFGEKYGNKVRVLTMGNGFSIELCGGTHVAHTGDIGPFVIVSESGVASGIRRIEARARFSAYNFISAQLDTVSEVCATLKAQPSNLLEKTQQMLVKQKDIEKTIEKLQGKLASQAGSDLTADAIDIAGVKVLIKQLKNVDPKTLRDLMDQVKNKLHEGVVLLAVVKDEKVSLIAGVTSGHSEKISAVALVNEAAQFVGGKGGGRKDMAQAGGTKPEHIEKALASAKTWVESQLNT